jgi:hypothetical protein
VAEKFDVASRLAEGRPAVEDIQTYVWACHALGYANPDLTLHAAQVRDWYGSEDGLDLRALDADCAALEAAVAAAEDAVARQDVGALSAAWQGDGADASRAFLRRHGEASAAAVAAVRTTADALATLRDNLWQTIDEKAAAAVAVADRAPDEWLAAAHTVTTAAGDRAAASERIDQEVKPFVDNDIRIGWLAAMRSAMARVTALYDAATAELVAESDAVFEVPGDLGPSWTPPPRDEEAATVPAAASAVTPAVAASPLWSAPAAPTLAPMPAAPVAGPPPAPPPVDAGSTAPAMAAPPSMPSLGGMPDIGGGLSGFGQQLADAFGSLLGSSSDELDTPDIDDPEIDDELDDDEEEGDDEPVEPAADVENEPAEEPVEEAVAEPACEPAETPIEPPPPMEPAPTPVPDPPPDPAPPPEPVAAETPCEIAADELPQVGE